MAQFKLHLNNINIIVHEEIRLVVLTYGKSEQTSGILTRNQGMTKDSDSVPKVHRPRPRRTSPAI